jgi:hypothetical protein
VLCVGGNFADHISELDKLVADDGSIVRSIFRDQGKAPCLILYNDDQLTDIKNICCTGQTPLGIDKTFNLCDMHMAATCYKRPVLSRKVRGNYQFFLVLFISMTIATSKLAAIFSTTFGRRKGFSQRNHGSFSKFGTYAL